MKLGKCFSLLLLSICLCSLSCCGTQKEQAPGIESLGEAIDLEEIQVADTGDMANGRDGESGSSIDGDKDGESGISEEIFAGADENSVKKIIFDEGETLETRIGVPSGYERVPAGEGSLAEFLRQFPLKPAGYAVHLYDGSEKYDQQDHVAVFALPIEEYDLQQCADSVMRVYAEYFWATEQYDRIQFHFTNGFLCEYAKWRDGYRISVNGNNVSWNASKSRDASYECFVKYLKTVFCYAGTLSMEKESEETTLSELKAGDVFLYGGSPGHVVMVADVCENEQGKKAFLLAQGYMPAQEFHLLKNDSHPADPWYYEEEVTYPFHTPEYVFQEGSLRKLLY